MARAKKGGEMGANGEWYEGGKFLNTVPENAKREGSVKAKPRKIEIEPYKWVLAPEGKFASLYSRFAGVFGKIIDGKAVVLCSDQTLAYFRTTREEAQIMADRYNAGERYL